MDFFTSPTQILPAKTGGLVTFAISAGRAKIFWTVNFFISANSRIIRPYIYQIWTLYKNVYRKINLNQYMYLQNGRNNWSCVSSKCTSDPDQFTAAADGVGVDRNSGKFDRMCMKGLTFLMWNFTWEKLSVKNRKITPMRKFPRLQ